MAILIFILLGVVGILANANNWFIVPQICINICFIIGVVLFIINMWNIHRANKISKRISKRL